MSQFYLDMMGFEWVVEIDYRVTSYGCPAQTYGPPENCYPAEGPEWEIESITLYRDEPPPEHLCGIAPPPWAIAWSSIERPSRTEPSAARASRASASALAS